MRYATLQDIYDAIPDVHCKGMCQACCGPIAMYRTEAEAIEGAGLRLPVVGDHPKNGALTCSALNERGRCSIYAVRPLICRLWGAVKAMRCPHGCAPKKWVSEERVHRFRERMAELSGTEDLIYTAGGPDEVSRLYQYLAGLLQEQR